jgi:hypothetical protein
MTRSRDIADQQDNLGGAVAPFVAGKNKIINGDFGVWQRGTSFAATANVEAFSADRWKYNSDGGSGSITISQQTFTPGAAPVAGYEGQYFWRYTCTTARTSQTYNVLFSNLEDVRLFAGQTMTISFWAKASSAVTLPAVYVQQQYGTGGSATTAAGFYTGFNVTTSWQRFTFTLNMPSISGKTIGTNSFLRPVIDLGTASNVTGLSVDIWGVQMETGNVATPFTTASGSIGGELALCQRYYYRISSNASNLFAYMAPSGSASLSTSAGVVAVFPVTMRVVPTSLDYANLTLSDNAATFAVSVLAFNTATGSNLGIILVATSTGLTAGKFYSLFANNSASAFLGISAEL